MISEDRIPETRNNCPKNSDCDKKFGVQNETSTTKEANSTVITNKEHLFQRLDKRKELLDQQRSSQLSERAKNIAEIQAVQNKVSNDVIFIGALGGLL